MPGPRPVHAFQGRTVDNVIAAMEARHPHLTTQKSFYVEISRARDRAELVTDDAAELRAQLQAVTGERIAALEGIGEMKREAPGKAGEAAPTREIRPERGAGEGIGKDKGAKAPAKAPEPPVRERGKGGMGPWVLTAAACRPGPGARASPCRSTAKTRAPDTRGRSSRPRRSPARPRCGVSTATSRTAAWPRGTPRSGRSPSCSTSSRPMRGARTRPISRSSSTPWT